jgi:hypothetical protein
VTTEIRGQAQTIEDASKGPDRQADGYREPSAIQRRIGEIALKQLGLIVNARHIEGVILLTNEDIESLGHEALASEIQLATRVIDAISPQECEEIAVRAGL